MLDPVSSLFVSYIVTNIAQKALEGYVQKFFTNAIADGVKSVDQKLAGDIVRKALRKFAIAFGTELQTAGLNRARAKPFRKPVMAFLLQEEVQKTLTEALKVSCHSIDARVLDRSWKTGHYLQLLPQWFPRGAQFLPASFNENYPEFVYGSQLPFLPQGFDWGRVSEAYFEAIRTLIKTDEQLRAVYTVELTEQIAAAQGIQPDFNLQKYAESLQETYGSLRIQSLTKSASLYNRPVKLFRVFVPQRALEYGGYLPPHNGQRLGHDRKRSTDPVQAFLEPGNAQYTKYLVVLGDPGSGKSSLLQWLALQWAHLKDTEPNQLVLKPLPIVIELRRYFNEWRDTRYNFLEFLDRGSSAVCHLNQNTLHDWLKRGQAIVMFDGLDEIFDKTHRDTIQRAIHRFTNNYPKVQVVVTSRPIGYDDYILRNAEFQHVMLQDFEDDQIEAFSQQWHKQVYLNDEPERAEKQERLARAIETSTPIRLLARNPLLLTLMAILNRYQELPRDRSELYGEAARLLLYQWDDEVKKLSQEQLSQEGRLLAQLDYCDKEKILQRLAFYMQTNCNKLSGNTIDKETLESLLSEERVIRRFNTNPLTLARKLIEQLHARNFILCHIGNDYYAFVHRTFLEYFCAQELASRFNCRDSPNAKNAIKAGELIELYRRHWKHTDWHEVLRLLINLIPVGFSGQAIEALLEQKIYNNENDFSQSIALLLAAECLEDLRENFEIEDIAKKTDEILKVLLEEIDATLCELSKYPDKNYNLILNIIAIAERVIENIASISILGSKNTLSYLEKYLANDRGYFFHRALCIRRIVKYFKKEPDCKKFLLKRMQFDRRLDVRVAAISALAEHFKNGEIQSHLVKKAQEEQENNEIRSAAISALAEYFKNEEIQVFLIKEVQQQKNFIVRLSAVTALAEYLKDKLEIQSLLIEHLQEEKHFFVRWAAANVLAIHFKNEATQSLLFDWMQNDKSSEVRAAAVSALAKHFKDENTESLLLDRVREDANSNVRGAAVAALAEHFKGEATHSQIVEWAKQDPRSDVRQAAVSALARYFKNDPETQSLLAERVRQDSDAEVRLVVLKAILTTIAPIEPQYTQTFELLCDVAHNDPFVREDDLHINPRQTALELLLDRFPNKLLETVILLRDRAENDPDEKLRHWAQEKLSELDTKSA
ncbi:HEAT repeat domain-containing protein [Geitlerinema sp. CS-897]|nr:HEAT repeat domain-containing protein [Geitlerinema sp. CS-897]